ncbi:MAG: hypothetical protein DMF04_01000, partial [Verrucomicrobia bacterium]
NIRDNCELSNNKLLELVRYELNLRFRERHKSAFLFLGLIVNPTETPALFANILRFPGRITTGQRFRKRFVNSRKRAMGFAGSMNYRT